jgi:hypothetical protein
LYSFFSLFYLKGQSKRTLNDNYNDENLFFLPAATSMIYEMGLESQLVGVTFECHSDKPKVVRSYLEGTNHTSKEIDQIVSQSKAQGKVYTI